MSAAIQSTGPSSCDPTVTFETITPAQAESWLANCNHKNRHLTRSRVNQYAALIRGGKWVSLHQGIAFDENGYLLDGQHRLAGCILAGLPFRTMVTRYAQGASEMAKSVIDTGKARGIADVMVFAGKMTKTESKEVVAILTAMTVARDGDSKHRDGSAIDVANDGHDGLAARWARDNLADHKRFASPMRAAFALMWLACPEEAEAFAAVIVGGAAEHGTPAATWMCAWTAGQLTTSGGQGERRKVMLRALRIMKSYVNEEGQLEKLYTTDEGLRFFMRRIEKRQKKAGLS